MLLLKVVLHILLHPPLYAPQKWLQRCRLQGMVPVVQPQLMLAAAMGELEVGVAVVVVVVVELLLLQLLLLLVLLLVLLLLLLLVLLLLLRLLLLLLLLPPTLMQLGPTERPQMQLLLGPAEGRTAAAQWQLYLLPCSQSGACMPQTAE